MKNSLSEKARTYRLPESTTAESLREHWEYVIGFGSKILLAGYYYQGKGQPSYFSAIYTLTKSNDPAYCATFHPENEIRLETIGDEFFTDEGHAFQWGMSHC